MTLSNTKKLLLNETSGSIVNSRDNLEKFQDSITYVQDVPSKEWSIIHNLDSYDMNVNVYVKNKDETLTKVFPELTQTNNQIIAQFDNEMIGTVILSFFGTVYNKLINSVPGISQTPISVTPTITPTSTPIITITPTVTITPTATPPITPSASISPSAPSLGDPLTIVMSDVSSLSIPVYGSSGISKIDWGDGLIEDVYAPSGQLVTLTHNYTEGAYTAKLYGNYEQTGIMDVYPHSNPVQITSWGTGIISKIRMPINITQVPNTLPSTVTNCYQMFQSCDMFNQDLSGWDTSNVITMASMFNSTDIFNGNISTWDVSHVNNMNAMFQGALAFNSDVSTWNTAAVNDMSLMFANSAFSGNVSNWNTSNVHNMSNMFSGLSLFNSDLSAWDVSGITDIGNMGGMFYGCTTFNQDLSSWCVSAIASEPSLFAFNANAWVLPKPAWGTCPTP